MTRTLPAAGSPLICVIADGPFGHAVADSLGGMLAAAGGGVRVRRAPPGQLLTRPIAGSDLCVRASWRDVRAEWEEFASAAASAGRPWLPVGLGQPDVRVGPAVVPGARPCHSCYCARARQHSVTASKWADDLESALARDPALGVGGFPPHIAAIAAAVAMGALQDALAPAAGRTRMGQVTLINCHTDAIRSWRVAAVHNCPACGVPANDEHRTSGPPLSRLRQLSGPALSTRGG